MGNSKDFISNSKKVDLSKFHLLEPDYSRVVYEIPRRIRSIITDKLTFLYGRDKAITTVDAIYRILKVYHAFKSSTIIDWEKGFDAKSALQKTIRC